MSWIQRRSPGFASVALCIETLFLRRRPISPQRGSSCYGSARGQTNLRLQRAGVREYLGAHSNRYLMSGDEEGPWARARWGRQRPGDLGPIVSAHVWFLREERESIGCAGWEAMRPRMGTSDLLVRCCPRHEAVAAARLRRGRVSKLSMLFLRPYMDGKCCSRVRRLFGFVLGAGTVWYRYAHESPSRRR